MSTSRADSWPKLESEAEIVKFSWGKSDSEARNSVKLDTRGKILGKIRQWRRNYMHTLGQLRQQRKSLGKTRQWSRQLRKIRQWSRQFRKIRQWSRQLEKIRQWSRQLGKIRQWSRQLGKIRQWSRQLGKIRQWSRNYMQTLGQLTVDSTAKSNVWHICISKYAPFSPHLSLLSFSFCKPTLPNFA